MTHLSPVNQLHMQVFLQLNQTRVQELQLSRPLKFSIYFPFLGMCELQTKPTDVRLTIGPKYLNSVHPLDEQQVNAYPKRPVT